MTRHLTLIGCAVLGVVLIAAVLTGGGPRFGQPRWVPLLQAVPPPPPATNQTVAPPQAGNAVHHSTFGPLVLLLIVVAFAIVAVWFVLRALLRARGARSMPVLGAVREDDGEPLAVDTEQNAEPDAPIVHRGLQLALDALDEEREPTDAVVKAWLGLQSAAEDSGVERRPAETPTEFTTRVITRVQADSAAAQRLVDVYQAVRFGGHPITSAEVRSARAAVEKLLSSWHEPVLRRR